MRPGTAKLPALFPSPNVFLFRSTADGARAHPLHCQTRRCGRNLIGDVYRRFEQAGLRIVAARMLHLTTAQAEAFYEVHRERPFYQDLVRYMSSGPVIAQVLEGDNAIARNRDIMGATDPKRAAPGTIRADLAESYRSQRRARLGRRRDRRARNRLLFQRHRSLPQKLACLPRVLPLETRVNLLGLPPAELEAWVLGQGSQPFRARQLQHWLYKRGVAQFEQMTDLAKEFRAQLGERAEIKLPEIVLAQQSADGTRKWLLRADASQAFEMVFIPETGRGTLCISSQVGCVLDCTFCSTAQQGFNRNLSTAEIVGQLWLANRELGFEPGGERLVTNVVFMGMGEPLANFRNVVPGDRRSCSMIPASTSRAGA